MIWVANREEIPYTGRMHCILVPTFVEQSIGESTFKQVFATDCKSAAACTQSQCGCDMVALLRDPPVNVIRRYAMKPSHREACCLSIIHQSSSSRELAQELHRKLLMTQEFLVTWRI